MGRGQIQDLQAGTSSQAGQTICYLCRQLGHIDELKSHPFSVHFSNLFLSKKRPIYVQKYGITNQTVMQQGIQEIEEFLQ